MAPEMELLLARSLSDYEERRDRGEAPRPEEYRAVLGEAYGEFESLVGAVRLLSEALEDAPPVRLPRPFGPYTLRRVVGSGAAGVVYEAWHERLRRREAVKILKGGAEGSEAWRRFRREAAMQARGRHPHLVPIHAAGEVEGQSYIAMDLVDGGGLDAALRAGRIGGFSPLCAGLADVADALGALHAAGVVHRDVKPSNILVESDGRFLLADLGLARDDETSAVTRTGQAVGTPPYMAPEQFRAEDVDARADVYGLGATLHAALTGRPPFRADAVGPLVQSVLRERPTPPSRLVPGLPLDADRVVLRCLEKRPADRYPTAADLAADLRALAAGRPVRGRPVGYGRRALRTAKRHALAAVLALAVLGAGAALYFGRPAAVVIDSGIAAAVFVDGAARGRVPAEGSRRIEFPSGRRLVELRHDVLVCRPFGRVDWGPGDELPWRPRWVAKEVEDPRAADLLEGLAARERMTFELATARAAGVEDARAIAPGGRVRPSDLTTCVCEFPDSWPDDPQGRVVFRRGEEELGAWPQPRIGEVVTFDLPASVRARLVVGDEVVWGYETAARVGRTQRFVVVPEDPDLEARLESSTLDQPGWMRTYLRGAAYLRAGLPTAALRAAGADGPLAGRAAGPDLVPWVVASAALQALRQGGSILHDMVVRRIVAFPPEVRAAWIVE